jgi:hypothetical protein
MFASNYLDKTISYGDAQSIVTDVYVCMHARTLWYACIVYRSANLFGTFKVRRRGSTLGPGGTAPPPQFSCQARHFLIQCGVPVGLYKYEIIRCLCYSQQNDG